MLIDSNYANAHSNLGVLYAKTGQLDEAITHFRCAVQIDPEDAEVHYNLGLTFAKADQLDEAVSYYHRALRLRPEYLPVLNNLAWILSTAADPGLRDPA